MSQKPKYEKKKTNKETLYGIFSKSPELLADGSEVKVAEILIDMSPQRNPALTIEAVYSSEAAMKIHGEPSAFEGVTREKRNFKTDHGIDKVTLKDTRTPEEKLFFHYH